MEPQELERKYDGSDANMTETARAIHDLFVLDVLDFKAFDATLDAAFGAQYLLQIKAAEQVVDDSVVIDQIVDFTEQAEKKWTWREKSISM